MLRSFWCFVSGLGRHGWAVFVFVFLDLLDAYQKVAPYLPKEMQGYDVPDVIFWPIVGLWVAWAAFRTFHEQYMLAEKAKPKFKLDGITIEKQLTTKQGALPVPHVRGGLSLGGVWANFIKLSVRNTGIETIHSCKVWVYQIERIGKNGDVKRGPDGMTSLMLLWSGTNIPTIDLDHNNPKDVPILYSNQNSDELAFWMTPTPNNILGFFKEPGIYRVFLRATGQDVPSLEATAEIDWTGKWDELTAKLI